MTRSEGMFRLSRLGLTQDEIAARVEVTRVAVSQWLNGATRPGAKKRTLLHEAYGIPPGCWDEVRSKPEAPSAPPPSSPPSSTRMAGTTDALETARMLQAEAMTLMDDVKNDVESTPLERAKVLASVSATLSIVAKLTGQFDLGARLFQLPVWKRVVKALELGLTGYPEAAASVAEELRRAEGEWTLDAALTNDRKTGS